MDDTCDAISLKSYHTPPFTCIYQKDCFTFLFQLIIDIQHFTFEHMRVAFVVCYGILHSINHT